MSNAAIVAGVGPTIGDASVDRLRSIFDVRVAGSLACVGAVRDDLEATGGTVVFSGTTYASGDVPEQIEWGAVAPAVEGLATSLSSALDGVQVTYVRIGSKVVPGEAPAGEALPADEVASVYLDLAERGAWPASSRSRPGRPAVADATPNPHRKCGHVAVTDGARPRSAARDLLSVDIGTAPIRPAFGIVKGRDALVPPAGRWGSLVSFGLRVAVTAVQICAGPSNFSVPARERRVCATAGRFE